MVNIADDRCRRDKRHISEESDRDIQRGKADRRMRILIRERAENAKEKYNVPRIYDTMYDAFNDPEVDIILNLAASPTSILR